MARPSEFTQETADRFCELIAEGKKLDEICGRDGMPAVSTMFRWMADRPEFDRHYHIARRARGHRVEDEILTIVDDDSADHRSGEEGGAPRGPRGCYVAVHRARLRAEMRLRLLSRFEGRRYGFDPEADAPGGKGDPPGWRTGPVEVEWDE